LRLREAIKEDEAATRASFDPEDTHRGVRATADLLHTTRAYLAGLIARLDLGERIARDRLIEIQNLRRALRRACRDGWEDGESAMRSYLSEAGLG
jgi:acyl-CoA reductase-like NAD-dependent aldehyde dehydrogenase